ncbi:MAG: YqgE/AlgH family protein [Cytophagales bacterium]
MKFDYFNFKSNNKVKKGSIIFSQPLMKDPNFQRSLIFICEHNNEGSFGYVLNEKINAQNLDIEFNNVIVNNLYLGGPVEKSYLNFIHNLKNLSDSEEIIDDVYLGGNIDEFIKNKNLNKNKLKYKFFSGYSGWSSDQLQEEINQNSWIVVNQFNSDILFKNIDDKFWSVFLSEFGGKNKIFSNYPKDPSLN